MSVKGLHVVRITKPGKPVRWYVYAHRGGPCILKQEGGTKPKLDRGAVAKLLAAMPNPEAETLRGLSLAWQTSPEWKALADSTKATWGLYLDAIEVKWGKTPLVVWNDPRMVAKVMAWRDDNASRPRAADIGVTVLYQLLKWGRLRARVTINVADGIPQLYRGQSRPEIIWTDEDVTRFREATKDSPQITDILDLAITTGFRRADLATVTLDDVGDYAIVRVAKKKSRGKRRRASIPITSQLREVLDRLKSRHRESGVRTLLVTSRGKPWAEQSISTEFHRVRDKLAIEHPAELDMPARKKHLHDCRGTFVTILCRAGLTDREIADIAAWSPESVATIRKVYVDDAAVVVALGQRIGAASVKRDVKR